LYIVQTFGTDDNAIQVGDPFFAAFLPIFDADNEMLGLALAARGIDGSSVTLVDSSTTPE